MDCGGIQKKETLKLDSAQLDTIEGYIRRASNRANTYIKELSHKYLTKIINDSPPDELAHTIMEALFHISLHGFEYMEIWDNIQKHGAARHKMYLQTICYDTFFGRQTSNSLEQAMRLYKEKPTQPLTPGLIRNSRNQISSLKGYIVRIGGDKRVGGLEITYDDGANYKLGTVTHEVESIKFKGARLKKLEVWGGWSG